MGRRYWLVVLLALSLVVVSADVATAKWSPQRCRMAAATWARHHPVAGNATIAAYLTKLAKLHGCPYTA
jgi:hypothetical protein